MIVGDMAPDVELHLADGGRTVWDYRGRALVLYFYPKDNTSGCTREAQAFNALLPEFKTAGAAVVGVSRDSIDAHAKFAAKYKLKVPLAADEDGSVCAAFGTWVEKSMYGKTYMGIQRATFLIDAQGRIAQA